VLGTIVVARCYNGTAALLRVWDWDKRTAYLAGEEQFRLLESGRVRGLPIGFPIEDVFHSSEPVIGEIKAGAVRAVRWSEMKRWSPENI
jgi:hypothetical protein